MCPSRYDVSGIVSEAKVCGTSAMISFVENETSEMRINFPCAIGKVYRISSNRPHPQIVLALRDCPT